MQKLTLATILSILINIFPGAFSVRAEDNDIQAGKTCKVTEKIDRNLNSIRVSGQNCLEIARLTN